MSCRMDCVLRCNYGAVLFISEWWHCLVLFFLGGCISVSASVPTQELFLRANSLYEQGQLQQALETYEKISPKGSAVWYNMGVCRYSLGQYPEALVCWRHAQRGASLKQLQGIARAINFVQHMHDDSHAENFMARSSNVLGIYVRALPLAVVQLMLLLGLCLLFFCSKWWYYGLHGKSLLLGASCMIVVGVMNVSLQYKERPGSRGVIVSSAAVYSGPDSQFHSHGTLAPATEVAIQKVHGQWYKVVHNTVSGWISADAIVVV